MTKMLGEGVRSNKKREQREKITGAGEMMAHNQIELGICTHLLLNKSPFFFLFLRFWCTESKVHLIRLLSVFLPLTLNNFSPCICATQIYITPHLCVPQYYMKTTKPISINIFTTNSTEILLKQYFWEQNGNYIFSEFDPI